MLGQLDNHSWQLASKGDSAADDVDEIALAVGHADDSTVTKRVKRKQLR